MPTIKADELNEENSIACANEFAEQNIPLMPTPPIIINNNNHAPAHVNNTFLRPSPSETSLTRSRSLILPTKTKHSPDCKDNPYKF